ncbi:hypothetical protein AC622_03280 [Bacillus sp. FJAT-27916]|uniref:hypothetical protein n=1 Tax=Bacillus sp. FJAT-27916 TaxID=1679169 RepID=UPI00067146DE|nr:hypothetical protein [Bacillus sp. FJAT-27916]KMY43395.1 hypothetical protein AC622_03280 [Bacillus sp. FJAT-27916]
MLAKDLLNFMEENELYGVEDANEILSELHYENGLIEPLEFIGGEDFIRNLAVALTHFCFRNGPVEDMHSGRVGYFEATPETPPEQISQLSQEDMKTLNKYMVDKLGFFFTLLVNERYVELKYLLEFDMQCGTEWDPPNIKKEWEECCRYLRLYFEDDME